YMPCAAALQFLRCMFARCVVRRREQIEHSRARRTRKLPKKIVEIRTNNRHDGGTLWPAGRSILTDRGVGTCARFATPWFLVQASPWLSCSPPAGTQFGPRRRRKRTKRPIPRAIHCRSTQSNG